MFLSFGDLETMKTELLLGDEAVAQAAIDAGIAGAFSYPGTPSTEIFEYIQRVAGSNGQVAAMWSANEKVAYEEALGISYAGKRAIVSMKHVGLNVAADPFINSALTGVNGGMVLVVADDPGMHSSQNEQDSRYYAEFAKIPAFEPSTQQQAYNMMWEAFELSEQVKLPVMLRLVTRLAHSRADVQAHHRGQYTPEDTAYSRPNPNDWTLVPGNARVRFRHLLALQPQLREISEQSTHNQLKLGSKKGIIASGIAYNYTKEALPTDSDMSLLRIGMYPLPVNLLKQLVDHCDEIFVMEDGYPYIEERLNGLFGLPGKQVHGKLSGSLPPSGELTPRLVATALNSDKGQVSAALSDLAPRPPQLCKGCPHIDTFNAMVKASADQGGATMFSDIGCYTLGVMPPFRAVHSCVDMGASIAMAHGASLAGAHPIICTIGDSTFAHSGMTGLIGAIKSNANMTVMILDNATVAMTGSQETMATGEQLMALLRGLGVPEEHLHLMDPHPKKHEENIELIAKAIQHRGLDVIVSRRPCIQIKRQKPK